MCSTVAPNDKVELKSPNYVIRLLILSYWQRILGKCWFNNINESLLSHLSISLIIETRVIENSCIFG